MADSDTPQPERSDLDFDLDFDLGDLEFDEPTSPAPAEPVAATPASNDVLSRDLESLIGGAEEPEPAPLPEPEPEPVPAPSPEPIEEPEIEELPDVDPAPEPLPSSEADEAPIPPAEELPEAKIEEIDDEVLLETSPDEEEELEVELDEVSPVEEIEAPEAPAEPEIEEEEPPAIEPEPELSAATEAERAAELRRQQRLEASAAESVASTEFEEEELVIALDDDEEEFEVVFEDPDELTAEIPALEEVVADEIPAAIEDPVAEEPIAEEELVAVDEIEDEIIAELESEEPTPEVKQIPAADEIDTELEALTAKLEQSGSASEDTGSVVPSTVKALGSVAGAAAAAKAVQAAGGSERASEIEDELEDVIEPTPVAEAAVEPLPSEAPAVEFDEDELVVDLDDEFDDLEAPTIEAAVEPVIAAPEEKVEEALEEIDDLDELDELDEIDDLGDLADSAALAVEGSADDLRKPAISLTKAPAAYTPDTADDDFEMPEPEFSAEEEEVEFDDATPAAAASETEDEFDAGIATSDDKENDEIVADDDPFDAEDDKKGRGMFSFRPLELAGLAAVLIACAVGLFMFSSNVSGVLDDAEEGNIPIVENAPTKMDGEIIQIGTIECFWRDRADTDRTDEDSIILPVVTLSEPSGSGTVQVLFYDSLGEIRGDGHSFRISNGNFEGGGSSVTALCTEGLKNEAQFAYYRSDSELAKADRWSVRIRESSDEQDYKELARFEFPATRR